jgi:hypothetical protein
VASKTTMPKFLNGPMPLEKLTFLNRMDKPGFVWEPVSAEFHNPRGENGQYKMCEYLGT